MGFRFRKSKSFGPFKINLSKSGIGWSIGTKGVRYTKRADDKTQTTLSIPGTGISYVAVKGKSKNTLQENYTNNQTFKNNNKLPFYKRLWFMWLMLFIIPPIGIVLLWIFSNYSKKVKVALSIIFALFTIARFSNNSSNINTKNLQATSSAHNEIKATSTESDTNATFENKKEETKLTGWQNSNGNYYYYDSNGNKETGWVNDNGTYYYLNTLGIMQTGWVQDTGKWYYLNKNGSMAHDTTIDGYNLASNGVMQEKAVINTQTNTSNNNSASTSSSFGNASKDVTTNESAPSGKTVYWTSSGKSYHYNRNCPTLSRSKNILSGDASTCPKKDPCDVCAK